MIEESRLEARREVLIQELVSRYGYTLLKHEASEALGLELSELLMLCPTRLPYIRRGGRGGNRYLARDIAHFKVEKEFKARLSIDRSVDGLAKDLIKIYGYSLQKRDLEAVLKLKSQAILSIPGQALPCDRRRGRSGNMYQAKDVALYMHEMLFAGTGRDGG